MQEWNIGAFMNSKMGDIYDVERAITAIRILKDEISTLTEVCNIHEIAKNDLVKAKEILKEAQSYERPFKEMAQKVCNFLDQAKPTHRELCQDPLNNDSWKYSVSQAFEKQMNEELNRKSKKKGA